MALSERGRAEIAALYADLARERRLSPPTPLETLRAAYVGFRPADQHARYPYHPDDVMVGPDVRPEGIRPGSPIGEEPLTPEEAAVVTALEAVTNGRGASGKAMARAAIDALDAFRAAPKPPARDKIPNLRAAWNDRAPPAAHLTGAWEDEA